MASPAPFFTIITATRNAAATLPRLLDSLASQTCRDFEVIIQDGVSTDNTIATAESFRPRLPALSITGEQDSGIYDAWNKALPRVRGEWILFLGADDQLANDAVLAQAKAHMAAYPPSVLFAAGDVEICSFDGKSIHTISPSIEGSTARLPCSIPAPHTALFHHHSLFMAAAFDKDFRIAGDYEFLCRAWKNDRQAKALCMTVTRMALGGVSNMPQKALQSRLEMTRAASRHFSGVWTLQRLKSLSGGAVIAGLCVVAGPCRTAAMLNRFRLMRGLPPCWASGDGHD